MGLGFSLPAGGRRDYGFRVYGLGLKAPGRGFSFEFNLPAGGRRDDAAVVGEGAVDEAEPHRKPPQHASHTDHEAHAIQERFLPGGSLR